MPRQYTQQTIEMMLSHVKEHGKEKHGDRVVFNDWYLTTICGEIMLHLPYTIDNREKGEYTAEL